MKNLTTMLLLLLPVLSAVAQPQDEWVRIYQVPPPDSIGRLEDVVFTADGGFAMTGAGNDSIGNYIWWLLLTDSEGRVTHQSFHPQQDGRPGGRAYSIIQDDEGGFVMGGALHYSDREQVEEFSVIRTDNEGDFLWMRRWFLGDGGGRCWAVIELKSGNFLACGGGPKIVVFNLDGETIWARCYANEFRGGQFRAVREIEGGAILAGFVNGQATAFKIDEQGDMVDHFQYGSGVLYGMTSCEGGFAATGTRSRGTLMIALKFDDNGNQVWQHEYE